jgi:NADH:ubiquinone oxidoreductase subunit E
LKTKSIAHNMEDQGIEITICMGSSCFSRGNKRALDAIKEYLSVNEMTDMVTFKGAHCFGNCDNGPILKINNNVFKKVTLEKLTGILDNFFESRK